MLSSALAAGMVCAARLDGTLSAHPSRALMHATTTQEIVTAREEPHEPRSATGARQFAACHRDDRVCISRHGLGPPLGARPELAGAQHHAHRSVCGRRGVGCLLAHHGRGDGETTGPKHHRRERRRRRRSDRVAAREECHARRLHDRLRPYGHACGGRRHKPEAPLRPQDRLRLPGHPPRDAQSHARAQGPAHPNVAGVRRLRAEPRART